MIRIALKWSKAAVRVLQRMRGVASRGIYIGERKGLAGVDLIKAIEARFPGESAPEMCQLQSRDALIGF
ncbi:hypothetical protein [Paraburkholderia sp.]|uniref:hypothetical protein n=1 Tax=Paraburkholderia sp. TaxID=1926495 RepID=UPI00286F5643|nr:hypothetical protein [Paraburkholderia sp.]